MLYNLLKEVTRFTVKLKLRMIYWYSIKLIVSLESLVEKCHNFSMIELFLYKFLLVTTRQLELLQLEVPLEIHLVLVRKVS